MSEGGEARGVARWRHWDAAAFGAGAVPLLVLTLFYTDVAPAAFNTVLLVAALMIYPVATFFAWRQRDGRLAAAGALLILLATLIASRLILMLSACLMGDCI
ncbi:hypothetical protein [Sphingopyxis sp. H115]|uniref:hypothetical protein n=1 Tax=Sphingopyxis sp. H115 TaxID=1759073 RepID=UPI000736AD4C|nr:hypothetical protein [Sphingopyxis sp. H115]KTE06576.1 hypothetical protein ATE71_16490 [Sphingopyxis sp. H115]